MSVIIAIPGTVMTYSCTTSFTPQSVQCECYYCYSRYCDDLQLYNFIHTQECDTNRAVQPQKMARGLNFGFGELRDCAICVAKPTLGIVYLFKLFMRQLTKGLCHKFHVNFPYEYDPVYLFVLFQLLTSRAL